MPYLYVTFRKISESQSAQMDSIRAVAAWAVAIGHAHQIFVVPTISAAALYFGLLAQAAVMVFFVLSGFLIGKSISRNINRNSMHFEWFEYGLDRFFRLYPALLFSIVVMCLIWLLAPTIFPSRTTEYLHAASSYTRTGIHLNWHDVKGSLIFQNGFRTITPDMNGPLWSLSIEVWYYVLAATIVTFIRRPIVLIGTLILIWLVTRPNEAFFIYLPVWAVGYSLSILHDQDRLKNLNKSISICFVFCTLSALLFAVFLIHPSLAPNGHEWINYFNVATGFAFAAVLATILCGTVRVPIFMASAARYSYTLYLVHVPIFLLIFGITEQRIVGHLTWAIGVAIASLVMAIAFARLASIVTENKHFYSGLIRRKPLTT